MTKPIESLDEIDKILHKAGLAKGFYRIQISDKSTTNTLSDTDTYDETKQQLETYITERERLARVDALEQLDTMFEAHPSWGFRDWHETNFMEEILADAIAQLETKEQVE